jgi:hypothetical protein
LAKVLLEADIFAYPSHARFRGPSIRHIYVSAPPLARCDPADVLAIIGYATELESFSDDLGLRRTRVGFGLSPTHVDPQTSPEAFAERLAMQGNTLTSLGWTTYDDGPFEPALLPILRGPVGQRLRYLELGVSSAFDASYAAALQPLTFAPDPEAGRIVLPSLSTLKVCIDAGALHTVADWSLPALESVAVIARDYSYASAGFASFLDAHGAQIRHLELGHSSAELSLVSARRLRRRRNMDGTLAAEEEVDLAAAVPSLKTLVCNADAEWRWQDPDWIAPHVLLPAHPTLERIAIRGIGSRTGFGDPGVDEDDLPLFPLAQQLDSLCLRQHFPSLRAIRDLSPAVRAYARHPETIPPRVCRFWVHVLRNGASSGGVQFEDCDGNVVPVPGFSGSDGTR